MNVAQRNGAWVCNHAWDIGARKSGLAAYCFTVGEVVAALGFSRNTVKKYIDLMIEEGHVREVVISPSITIYKFTKEYVAYRNSLEALALQ